jgi:hypothetical protein
MASAWAAAAAGALPEALSAAEARPSVPQPGAGPEAEALSKAQAEAQEEAP